MSRLIDADALMTWFNNHYDDEEVTVGFVSGLIKEQPTIEPRCETCEAFNKTRLLIPQPERKKGKWINDRLVSTNGGTYGVRRCSECEAYYQDVGYGWNYCPNCGARMER